MRRTPRNASVHDTHPLKRTAFKTALAPLLAFALALVPILATPRVSDDVINYSFRWLSSADYSRAVLDEIRYWILSSGRIFVLSTYLKNSIFQVFEGAPAYKAFMLAANVGCAAAFFAYARLASRSSVLPVAALLALPILLQLRDYHDPVLSFNGLFQLCGALIFAALAFQVKYARTGDRRWLQACVAAFVANLFVYEMAALTAPLLWLQERLVPSPGKARYRATRWILVVLAVYLALVVAARVTGAVVFGMTGSIYGLGLNPGMIAATFAKQLLAVVPFAYAIFRPREGAWGVHAQPDPTPWLGSWHFLLALPAFVALAWLAMRLALRADAPPGEHGRGQAGDAAASALAVRALAWVAAGLTVFPALMISVVGRYHGAFGPGNGYSPVYLQMFGVALGVGVLSFVLAGCGWRRGGPWIVAATTLLGVAAAGNLVNNFAVSASLVRAWDPQHAWGAMLRSPDFREMCANAAVVPLEAAPWTEYRVVGHAGFRFAAREVAGLSASGRSVVSGPICVARGAKLLERNAAVYTLLSPAAAGDSAVRETFHIVLPLAPGEVRAELAVGAQCLDLPHRLALRATSRHSGRRFGLFVLEVPRGEVRWHAGGFALPCEKLVQ
jgi:hypothetical protein